ncbi:MAG: rhodanese-like domain-containing protein [Saprospiraceae bacterium]|nr:rhodanese-like domain-containing protein [Saprospiraceae bacterium]
MQYLQTISLVLFLCCSACQTNSGTPQVSTDAFKSAMTSNAPVQLIDVRTRQEFESGHIAGALNWDIETGDFKRNLPSLDKNRQVLVYCAVGGRSATAANMLQEAGFTQVLDLKGGIKAWKAAGLPTE